MPRFSLPKLLLAASLLLVCLPAVIHAYVINGNKWPGAQTRIYVGMPGTSATGIPWSVALTNAAREWNDKTAFHFQIDQNYLDPCKGYASGGGSNATPSGKGDGLNGMDFKSTVCGSSFNQSTLAIAMVFTEDSLLGTRNMIEADIVFNSNRNYDIYDGPINQQLYAGVDFQRVALHELGHVIGLLHESNSNIPAIMAPNIGGLFRLQQDDIAGANVLYAGANNCDVTPLGFGAIDQSLTTGDCLVNELMSGGTDTSFVDVYRFTLSETARITLETRANSLDSVLLLADENMKVLTMDDNSAGGCDALIRRVLEPGTYLALVNTYTGVASTECGATTGPYQLTFSYDNSAVRTLSGAVSFKGGRSQASFRGGVTIDQGASFTSRVTPQQLFDVRASIEIDPAHRDQPGFIVVAALLDDGEILVKNSLGDFVVYDPEQTLIPITTSKVLGGIENINILSTMATQLGIQNINVNFLVGYGLHSSPGELYFHMEPINLLVRP